MRQITLTLSEAPGDWIVCNLDLSNFFLESGLWYFLFLSICLLLVYFVSAAGCHCFDLKDIC